MGTYGSKGEIRNKKIIELRNLLCKKKGQKIRKKPDFPHFY